MAEWAPKQNLKKLGDNKFKTGTQVVVAGAAIATAILSEHFGGEVFGLNHIKDLPEAAKILLDDGIPLHKFMECKVPPNPNNFHAGAILPGDSESPVTLDYLRSRRKKKRASSVVTLAGIASSPFVHGFNPVGGAKEASAFASTMMHIAKIGAIGVAYRHDQDVAEWVRQIEAMKSAKAVIRGGKLVGALVPAGSAWAAVSAEALKLGVDFLKDTLCKALGAEIHYIAGKSSFDAHPAAREIVRELFTRRGATRIFGHYDVDTIIAEPGGWLAVADKIALI